MNLVQNYNYKLWTELVHFKICELWTELVHVESELSQHCRHSPSVGSPRSTTVIFNYQGVSFLESDYYVCTAMKAPAWVESRNEIVGTVWAKPEMIRRKKWIDNELPAFYELVAIIKQAFSLCPPPSLPMSCRWCVSHTTPSVSCMWRLTAAIAVICTTVRGKDLSYLVKMVVRMYLFNLLLVCVSLMNSYCFECR